MACTVTDRAAPAAGTLEGSVPDRRRAAVVAARLSWAMTRRAMSIASLARESGVSESALSRYCSGRRLVTTDALMRICPVLNLSADWLLGLREARAEVEKREARDKEDPMRNGPIDKNDRQGKGA